MSASVLNDWKSEFRILSPGRAIDVRKVYTDDVRFEDPVHRLQGVEAVDAYFRRLNKNLISGSFEFGDELVQDGIAAVFWTMRVRVKRIKEEIVVPGASHLRFGEKISFHRDYYDLGEMVYERIPLVGGMLRAVKRRM